jgi:hypothetical protein
MRQRKILRLHRGFAAREGRFALRHCDLTALNFPLGDVFYILAKTAQANNALQKSDKTGKN